MTESKLTSKQRAELRSLANQYDAVFQIGKEGLDGNENLIKAVNDALEARELIKLSVLNNSGVTAKEAALNISEKTRAEIIQVIGNKFILYRKNPDSKKRKIELK
ncbi:MAG: YhbY family RNA-binding protein [Oscillospiraceae bacterium]|nr:YhbY family RNA-binding protein [Oscillospiraceae bacterium]